MSKKTRLKFFIVDDDPDISAHMKALLESDGHAVATVESSVKAVPAIVAQKPDCVLVNLMMPERYGLELCRDLKQRRNLAKTKIIVVSGKPYESDRKQAFEVGADGYLTKPLNADAFVAEVLGILEDRIELTFWGVRGTLPVPGRRSIRYGGSTSCVSLEFSKGEFFIFDAGTGIKNLSDRLMSEDRHKMEGKIFISHPHWDHINALPFFAPLYVQGNEFEVLGASHGNVSLREMISAQMDGLYFPVRLKQFGARVYFRNLQEEEFTLGDIAVRTKLLNHPGRCLGYRVDYKGRSICYITDNELDLEDSHFYNPFYVKRLIEFIHGCDVLITDTTYSDEEYASHVGWGHSCVSRVVDLAHRAQAKTLYLFHHDPDQTDDDIDAKLAAAQKLLKSRRSKTVCLAPREGDSFKI
ncbi:MAG: response regulator [Hyphomicrobiales bacterium]|nr:response regulator [Hyphomicrobiales bacterium]MCP5374301.1 response regulator [Hyphomicrobiales bacterium]